MFFGQGKRSSERKVNCLPDFSVIWYIHRSDQKQFVKVVFCPPNIFNIIILFLEILKFLRKLKDQSS